MKWYCTSEISTDCQCGDRILWLMLLPNRSRMIRRVFGSGTVTDGTCEAHFPLTKSHLKSLQMLERET